MGSSSLDMQLAVVGLPGSGKTSFLAALQGTAFGPTTSGSEWTVEPTDAETRAYLREAWSQLRDGQPVDPTSTYSAHPELSLRLRRELRGRLTDELSLKCIDTAGEFAKSRDQRSGEAWNRVAQRIRAAHIVLLVFDAMNVLHAQDGDRRNETLFDGLSDMLFDAGNVEGDGFVPLKQKLLGVCFCKCDAVSVVDIDGFDDERDAIHLANLLVPPHTQKSLIKGFARVAYFGVSVLRDRWRWTREGACVRVGEEAIEPVGLFEPFEWISRALREEQ